MFLKFLKLLFIKKKLKKKNGNDNQQRLKERKQTKITSEK